MDLYYVDTPFRDVYIAFDYIVAIFVLQLGLLFIKQWRKDLKKQLKNIVTFGFGVYFILFSVGLFIIFFIMNHTIPSQEYDFYFVVSIYLRSIAGFILAFLLERTIQKTLKTRYLISIALIGFMVVIPFFFNTTLLYSFLNLTNILIVILPLLFTLYFIRNTVGGVRQRLILTIPGFLLLALGLVIVTPGILEIIEISLIFSSVIILASKLLAILGITLIMFGFNGYSFFLESQWKEYLISLVIIDKTRLKAVYHKNFLAEGIANEEILAGGITGIETIIRQFTSSQEGIDVIKLENRLILLSHGEKIITALIVKKNIQNAKYILKEITKKFEFFFWDYLKYYESYTSILSTSEIFKPMEMLLRTLLKI